MTMTNRLRLAGGALLGLALAGAALALLAIATTPLWRPPSLALPPPLPQWAHAAAAVFAGVFLLHADRLPRRAAAALLLALFLCTLWTLPHEGVGLPYAIGLGAVALVASGRFAAFQAAGLALLSECTLGIYFAHILVLSLLSRMGRLDGFVLAVATFALSALPVMALRKAFPCVAKYWS